jgi:hypothetical protein
MRVVALLAIAACAPTLSAQSAAPPGRSARLDEITGFWGNVKSYKLELSQGVALAFTCNHGSPCEHMTLTTDSAAIAEVRHASLGTLERSGQFGQATSTAGVVIGKSVGVTHVWVKTSDGDRDIAVTIIAPPAPLQPLAASR